MSVRRPVTVGSVAMSSRWTAVAAPVRFDENTGSVFAVTVTDSDAATLPSVMVRSDDTPSETLTSRMVCGWKPSSDAVRV